MLDVYGAGTTKEVAGLDQEHTSAVAVCETIASGSCRLERTILRLETRSWLGTVQYELVHGWR